MKQPATYYHVKESKGSQDTGTQYFDGKTYSILTALVERATEAENGVAITIARKTFPAVRASVMRDFFNILHREDIYVRRHNKSEATYKNVRKPGRVHQRGPTAKGPKGTQKRYFINRSERGNPMTLEDWRQLVLRTTDRIIIDYNPSDEFHWIYDEVIPRPDSEFFQTTYNDNPYLEETVVHERLKDTDGNSIGCTD